MDSIDKIPWFMSQTYMKEMVMTIYASNILTTPITLTFSLALWILTVDMYLVKMTTIRSSKLELFMIVK